MVEQGVEVAAVGETSHVVVCSTTKISVLCSDITVTYDDTLLLHTK
jgi:hypothetical protein